MIDLSNLITDRTQSDVDNKTEKGFYNISDLNRVESTVQLINNELTTLGFNLEITVKADWLFTDIVEVTDVSRYLTNIQTISESITMPSYSPELPVTLDYLTFSIANNIERYLYCLGDSLNRMENSLIYSNEAFCGEF